MQQFTPNIADLDTYKKFFPDDTSTGSFSPLVALLSLQFLPTLLTSLQSTLSALVRRSSPTPDFPWDFNFTAAQMKESES
jgi:hypothetical protein